MSKPYANSFSPEYFLPKLTLQSLIFNFQSLKLTLQSPPKMSPPWGIIIHSNISPIYVPKENRCQVRHATVVIAFQKNYTPDYTVKTVSISAALKAMRTCTSSTR